MSDRARLRILHVVQSARFAGVERFILRLAMAQARDHDVRVIGGDPAHMAASLAGTRVRFRPSGTLAETMASIRSVVSTVDVVNTHMTAADVAAVASIGWRRGLPAMVATRHFTSRRGSTGPGVPYRLLERRFDAEISISRAVAASIRVPSIVIPTGIDAVPEVPPADRTPTVLMAQRLQPEKRTDLGIRAFAASGLADAGWTLEVAGDGSERDNLEALTASLGLTRSVRMLGFVDDVRERMARAGLLLAPCPVEGLGLSVLEAMACGLPVIASASGGHLELLDGLEPRALFAPGDPRDAGELMALLGADADLRARLGSAERQRQREGFTTAAQNARTTQVYREAIAARGCRR
jgi:glycosyltransferase involved in cell wall biosynthesis